MTLQTLGFSDRQIELLFEAVHKAEKHCKQVADRPLQGYGHASEQMKKEKWKEKAEEYSEIASLLVETTT